MGEIVKMDNGKDNEIMGTEKIRKQMRQLIERQSNFVRPFIDNIDTVNRLNNNPVQLLVDKDNLYIATIA